MDVWDEGPQQASESTQTCSICHETKLADFFDKRRKFPLCKQCGREAKASGKKVQIKASVAAEVKTNSDLVGYAAWKLGCQITNYKINLIIFSYCEYKLEDLASLVDWCADNSKHPDQPWKILIWADEFLESRMVHLVVNDPIESRLQKLYTTADPDLRKRIREVAGKPDKRAALALLQEVQ